ncbi:hypothetical protein D3C77_668370 [compost metagenome]
MRCFNQILRGSRQGGDINHHHIPCGLPDKDDNESPKSSGRRSEPWKLEERQAGQFSDGAESLRKNKLPNITEQYSAYYIRHKEDSSQNFPGLYGTSQNQGET